MTTPSSVNPQSRLPGESGTRSTHLLTPRGLRQQNRAFQGTRGVSQGNRSQGFAPAFLDPDTGTIHLARYADGRPAPIHLLAGLPPELVVSRDAAGACTGLKPALIAGFVRTGQFYTREQAAGSRL